MFSGYVCLDPDFSGAFEVVLRYKLREYKELYKYFCEKEGGVYTGGGEGNANYRGCHARCSCCEPIIRKNGK